MVEETCKFYRTAKDCLEWVEIGETNVLTVSSEAKKCNPELAEKAKEILKNMKVNV
ncbi:hypothetical protein HZA97_09660 [Candidatus Woesearchaeota archaeon]|nr:hypothetical protein [Candidatus Woesearchaeota archaeon]